MDFIYLNVLGFSCYSAYNLAFFYSSEIQEEYKRRNNGQENLVRANDQRLEWIDTLYFLSYVKLIISFIKYVPQAYINYQAKSTVGWSIYNILLDFTGGVLSIAQLILDASLSGDWSGVSGDLVKFGLGFLSIAFDLVFMTQHYILYRDRTDYAVKENGHGIDGHSNLADRDNERQGLLDHGPKKKYGGSQRSYDPENGSQGSGARE
ncbi:hypothetical protein EDD11_006266 [Mortierella claussenii]|nr:hypothetical protein EDD11_006266 [Mortierella claussenii]